MDQHKIAGNWVPCDDSANRLELAPTEQPGVIAMRDTHDPDTQLFATANQLQSFVAAAEKGRLERLIGR